MALNSAALQSLMISKLASKGITGSEISNLAGGVSEGIVESFLAQNVVITADTGLAPSGPGIGFGKMIGLNPSAMASMMFPMVAGQGVLGSKSRDLVQAVSEALCLHFLSANIVNTIHPAVVLGIGVGKVTALQPQATAALVSSKLMGKGVMGEKMINLAKGISSGFVSNVLATAIVNVAIAGTATPIPVPSAGVGTGKVT